MAGNSKTNRQIRNDQKDPGPNKYGQPTATMGRVPPTRKQQTTKNPKPPATSRLLAKAPRDRGLVGRSDTDRTIKSGASRTKNPAPRAPQIDAMNTKRGNSAAGYKPTRVKPTAKSNSSGQKKVK